MRRIGRTWYQMNADGSIGQVYADPRSLTVDGMPFPNVPGLPGSTVGARPFIPIQREYWRDERSARRERPPEYSQDFHRARSYVFEIDWSQESDDPLVVLRRKVAVLAERGATEGERSAARAALERIDKRRATA